jgi:ABC-type oligopeptide transport system ATPase subunit
MSAAATPLLQVEDLHKHYPVRGGVWGRTVGTVRAVAGVSFSLSASPAAASRRWGAR